MIPATSITEFDADGKAWTVANDPRDVWGADENLDRPCDTCGGTGAGRNRYKCPDCGGTGRHTFVIKVARPQPQCDAAWPEHSVGDYNPSCCRFPKSCSAYESVAHRVSVVPGMVLPIHQAQGPIPETEFIADWGDRFLGQPRWVLMPKETSSDAGQTVTLPPDAKPGMWAVQVQRHE